MDGIFETGLTSLGRVGQSSVVKMKVPIKSYAQMLLQRQDVFAIYPFFAALARDRPIPASWELLVSIVTWISATRSGVWTYYEATSPEQQNAVYASLLRHETFNFLAEHYRFGIENWRTEHALNGLDRWLDENEKHIQQLLIDMVTADEEALNSFPSDSAP